MRPTSRPGQAFWPQRIRGWQFGDPARAIELALAGGGVDMPLAAFAFEVNEAFQYHYNLFVPWKD